ncbi:MAG: flippase [Patescibacteria group bacterium]
MSLTKKIAHNTIIQIVGKVISTILGLFALALITRYLGLEGFGEYTTVTTFLTFFAVIADLGLTVVTMQMISGHHSQEEENKIINNLFGVRLISTLILFSLAPITVIFFPYSPTVKLGVIIAIGTFIFPSLSQVIIGLFQKKLSMGRNTIAEVLGRITLILGIIIAKYSNSGLNGILIVSVVSSAINFIVHYILALKFATIKLAYNWSLWKKILSKSWPITITIIFNLIYLRADILLLSIFRGNDEIGLYGAAYKIIDVLTTLPFMFGGLILPIITTAWLDKNYNYFQKVLQKSFDFMMIIAIPLVIGAQFLGRPLISLIAGKDFGEAGVILQILIFAVAAIFIGTMFSYAVIAMDKQKRMIKFYAFTSITALAGYLILIPRFSYFGAAAITVYSEALIAVCAAVCLYKYNRWLPSMQTSLKVFASSIIMGIFLYFLPKTMQETGILLLLSISGASIIYFSSLYLLGGIKKEDLTAIFSRSPKNKTATYGSGQAPGPGTGL